MGQEAISKELIQDFESIIEQYCNQSSRDAHYEAAKRCASRAAQEVDKQRENWYVVSAKGFWRNVIKSLSNVRR
jgi:hypothetical protein